MSPAALVLAVLGMVVSAQARVTVPVLGPAPVLGIVALAVVLALAAVVLCLVRALIRDIGQRAPAGGAR